jgi:hypothetical protein
MYKIGDKKVSSGREGELKFFFFIEYRLIVINSDLIVNIILCFNFFSPFIDDKIVRLSDGGVYFL